MTSGKKEEEKEKKWEKKGERLCFSFSSLWQLILNLM